MAPKTYTNAELNALISEFSSEFDALVKAEVAAAPLKKAEGDEPPPPKKEASSPPASAPESDSGGLPPGEPPADASASPAGAPPPDAAAASPEAPGASGADPVEALKQAYAQLSPEELQQHILAISEIMKAQQASAPPAPGADPMASAAGAPPAGPPAGAPPPAPMAGEGSKPVDPMSQMALKSEFEAALNLMKAERDAAAGKAEALEKSVEALTETLTKAIAQPIRKAVTGKDIQGLLKSEMPVVDFFDMSKAEITKKLTAAARNPELKKSDRELINNFYKGSVKVDALAHLLG